MNPDQRRTRRATLRPTARPRPCASCSGTGCVTFDTGDVVACPRCPSTLSHRPARAGARRVRRAPGRRHLGVLERVLVALILLVSAATSVGAIAFLCEAIARWA